MKFFCNSLELSDAITVVSRALNKKTIPILEGIKICAIGKTVVLTATDLDMFIEKKINAEVFIEGETVVPGKLFADIVKKLTSIERLEVEKVLGEAISIRYGESKGELKCLTDAFPEMNKETTGEYIKTKEKDLKEIMDKTIFCVAADATKAVIKGCLFDVKGPTFKMVALDGYRIAVNKMEVETNIEKKEVIVSGRILSEINKILSDSEEESIVYINDRNIVIDLGHTVISCVPMEGNFINYEDLIQKDFETFVTVKISEILDSLDRVTIISRGKNNNQTKMIFAENQINIKVESDVGTIDENIVAKISGKDIEIAFNSRYLYEALSKIKKEYCCINLKSPNSPAIMKEVDNDNSLFMVLPVRLIG